MQMKSTICGREDKYVERQFSGIGTMQSMQFQFELETFNATLKWQADTERYSCCTWAPIICKDNNSTMTWEYAIPCYYHPSSRPLSRSICPLTIGMENWSATAISNNLLTAAGGKAGRGRAKFFNSFHHVRLKLLRSSLTVWNVMKNRRIEIDGRNHNHWVVWTAISYFSHKLIFFLKILRNIRSTP